MIRHIVLVKFDPATPECEQQAIFSDLRRLGSVVSGMSGFVAGVNISPENLDQGFAHAFTIDFESTAGRDAYLVHPAHQQAGARLVRAAAGGIEGVLVIDIEW